MRNDELNNKAADGSKRRLQLQQQQQQTVVLPEPTTSGLSVHLALTSGNQTQPHSLGQHQPLRRTFEQVNNKVGDCPNERLAHERSAQIVGFLNSDDDAGIRNERQQKLSSPSSKCEFKTTTTSTSTSTSTDARYSSNATTKSPSEQTACDDVEANKPQNDRTKGRSEREMRRNTNNNNNNNNKRRRSELSYWHHKQTGIKSRPIKLIKHPIEHIERKIILTYLLGFLFKFIAIISGPLIVLFVYLLIVPSFLIRRFIWFLMNLTCTFDARIKTLDDEELKSQLIARGISLEDGKQKLTQSGEEQLGTTAAFLEANNKIVKQIYWNYCPFNYLETYWFKERLVNTVVLTIDCCQNKKQEQKREANDKVEWQFCIDKLRNLVRNNLLSKPTFRKFLSQVVKRGFPFYKSYYWHYLGLLETNEPNNTQEEHQIDFNLDFVDDDATEDADDRRIISDKAEEEAGTSGLRKSSQNSSSSFANLVGQFSSTTSETSAAQTQENIQIEMDPEVRVASGEDNSNESLKVDLNKLIFLDKSFGSGGATKPEVRRYIRKLIDTKLDLKHPLWEIRLLPAAGEPKLYLIFRCHQSLADGRSLSKILTENLTFEPSRSSASDGNNEPQTESIKQLSSVESSGKRSSERELEEEEEEEENESELRPIKEKPSFVERVSKANSMKSAILVGPLTVLLWIIWTFTRRKNNHLNKRASVASGVQPGKKCETTTTAAAAASDDQRRFYMTSYSLTKIHQIKQMTRSTVSDVILCALSGALRDYLRKFNGVTNPPNLNISLTVDMRQKQTTNNSKHKLATNTCPSDCPPESSKEQFSSSTATSDPTLTTATPIVSPQSQSRPPPYGTTHLQEMAPGVNCTLINVPLPTSVEGTVPRLWELRNTMDELRNSADPWVMIGLQKFLFYLMPVPWYQWLINYVALRNSSTFVSNIRGPQNLVEAWCVDLLQRAIYESQQAPRTIQTDPDSIGISGADNSSHYDDENFLITGQNGFRCANERIRRKQHQVDKEKRVKLLDNLGSISEIYYCMQPPSGNIPISFNCITYYNKLFVTSLSRSLLVEDSKLLIRLFFRQLDQLTNTIAKRRSLVTIVRTPVPIEISCQPASPPHMSESAASGHPSAISPVAAGLSDSSRGFDDEDSEVSCDKTEKAIVAHYRYKDDLEANLGAGHRANSCKVCDQPVCTCRRRKSLFNFDHNQRTQSNLLSFLMPIHHLKGTRSGASRSFTDGQDGQWTSAAHIECLCGQQLLEELDEEQNGAAAPSETQRRQQIGEASSLGSRSPSDDGDRTTSKLRQGRPCCSKCHRRLTKRSTLSLNDELQVDRRSHSPIEMVSGNNNDGSRGDNNSKLGSERVKRNTHSFAQLDVPHDHRFHTKVHSKSETDLLPSARIDDDKSTDQQRGFWFAKGRLSMFGGRSSNAQQQRFVSPKSSSNTHSGSQETVSKSRHRNLIEMPAGFKSAGSKQPRHFRRQSVATSTGVSHNQWSVVVKDKINNDVSLRYQLDSPFMGLRNRRFSTIGNAVVGSQRRASLLPFGLIHNQSLPKLLWDGDGEAHL